MTRPAVAGELPDGVMVRAGGTPGLLAGGYRPLLHPTAAGGSAPPGPDAPVGRVLGR